ncbi:Mitochondrial glycoprotein family protein [Corchorus capsularis]|uniref:Mitochondrial glycoprotein family protein n=1 Tax=Corchorus capsularis TaxID=210143 RepID=A0A1R3GM62_COCAP|nr:Mitochondrial glycoprotein family protein [Corchorus capsularis]
MENDYGNITLTREYNDEHIEIEVDWDDLTDEDSSFPFVVSITKEDYVIGLKFECTAISDKIEINDFSIEDYEYPDQFNLTDKLKEGFVKYLEMRGIEASTSNSLHKYMMSYKNNRDDVNYVRWLKTLKKLLKYDGN